MGTALLIRHAQSEANLDAFTIGGRNTHVSLTIAGEQQARILGERIKTEYSSILTKRFSVYVSPTIRAYATAKIVLDILRLPNKSILFDNRLHELSQGDWEGKSVHFYTRELLIQAKQGLFAPPGGETGLQVKARMKSFFESLHRDKDYIVISHGLAMKWFLENQNSIQNTDIFPIFL